MGERSVVIIGLPESGKTTYLAALWHLVTSADVDTVLRFGDLRVGSSEHLNAIAARWRSAIVQERTAVAGNRLVSMNLLNAANDSITVTFPDVPGEAYRRMCEDRDCEPQIARMLATGMVLLFVHADTIRAPRWIAEEVAVSDAMGVEGPHGPVQAWSARTIPTQVQLVDLLQLLRMPPLDIGPRRVAVMLSAWDKVRAEELLPADYLQAKLPLLHQYLSHGADDWDYRIYGTSAQGCDYDRLDESAKPLPEAETIRNLDQPSKRIQLVLDHATETHDLTEPLAWLMA